MIIEPDQHYFEDGVYRWTADKAVAAWDDCCRKLDEALSARAFRKVVILVGIPGAGKSTFARANDAEDVIFFDGLFVNKERRTRVVAVAANAGVPVEAVWFDLPWQTCYQRNDGRSIDRRIPDDALERMQRQLDADPPTTSEGLLSVQRIAS